MKAVKVDRQVQMTICGRGALIVVEGLDRTGKSTQCRLLVERIEAALGKGRAQLQSFPDRTTAVGKMLDHHLRSEIELNHRTAHQLFAANRSEMMPAMAKKIESGISLVVDRYAYSGIAYTCAKGVPGLSQTICKGMDAGLLAPDAVFFLDLDPVQAAQRGNYGQERYEAIDFQTKVREQFRSLKDPTWNVIDASKQITDISDTMFVQALQIIEKCQSSPVEYLWCKQ